MKTYYQQSDSPIATKGVTAAQMSDEHYEQLKDKVEFLEPDSKEVKAYLVEKARLAIPSVVTLHQARAALINAGLLDKVSAAIAAIEDVTARALAQNDWDYAPNVRRDSALVQSLAEGLKLDDGELDALFTAAAAL